MTSRCWEGCCNSGWILGNSSLLFALVEEPSQNLLLRPHVTLGYRMTLLKRNCSCRFGTANVVEFALVAIVGAATTSRGAVGIGVRGVVALALTIAFLLALQGALVAVLALVISLLLAWVGLVA